MDELIYSSAAKLADLIRSKKASSVDVIKAHFDRINKVNPSLNAIVQQLSLEEALKEAKKADEAVAKGKKFGKLQGVPVTIKDALKVKGFMCCCGCKGLYGKKSRSDATIVSRLRKEGAIIIGITNVPELMISPETDNDVYGRTNNPYNLKLSPGGSSGGEAAIIAAGGSPLGIGSDAGGSIRYPAHCCGIAGLKPTNGLIPNTGNILGDNPGIFRPFITFGPMSRYVEDLILSLPIIAGPDEYDSRVIPITIGNPEKVILKSLRVAYYSDAVSSPSSEIANTILEVKKALEKSVASIEENSPKILSEAKKLLWETIFLAGDEGEGMRSWLEAIGVNKPSFLMREFLNKAKNFHLSIVQLRRRLVELDEFRNQMFAFMHSYDVLICPVSESLAKPHGTIFKNESDFVYTMSYTLTGWPCVVVRCGTSKDGLPIGVQVIANSWRDDIALAVAKHLEDIFGGWQEIC